MTPRVACALTLGSFVLPSRPIWAQSAASRPGSGAITTPIPGLQLSPTLVVNSLQDSDDGACTIKHCSLREAIKAANGDGVASAITFEDGLSGTLTLTRVLPTLSTNLVLQGPGARVVTVDGNDTYRLFLISNGQKVGPKVSIAGLTLSRGSALGASEKAVGGKEGGAIFNDHGTLSLSQSLLRGNTARNGGAIFNSSLGGDSASLNITSCTLSSNNATFNGGAIVNLGTGGVATLGISNSTLYGNGAESAAAIANIGVKGRATASIESSTIAGNGARFGTTANLGAGGIATLSLGNTILQDASSLVSLINDRGTISSRGYNLCSGAAGGNAGTSRGGFLNQVGDIRNTDAALESLGDNGGPTPTITLQPSSPAIDAGQTDLTIDQRGAARPSGRADDIGAFEAKQDPRGAAALVVTTAADTVLSDGLVSLREAIRAANTDGVASKISFDAAAFATNQTVALRGEIFGELSVANDGALSIDNTLPRLIEVSGGGKSRIFFIAGATVSLQRLKISGGNGAGTGGSGNGGAIYNDGGALSLGQCMVKDNSADSYAGGIWTEGGSVDLLDSTLSQNSAINGAGLFSIRSNVEIERSTLSGNICRDGNGGGGGGGAIENNTGSTLTLRNSTISGNSALFGGGVSNFATLSVQSCTFTGNTATYPEVGLSGGAIQNMEGATTTVENSLIADNTGAAPDVAGQFLSQGFNLIGQSEGSSGFGAPGDRSNLPANLGPLADNGGLTLTHALLEGSAALDGGQTDLATDQRGVARAQGRATDIGAFESALRGNTPPVALTQNAEGQSDVPSEITLAGSDADGDALSFEIVTQPKYGSLEPLGGSVFLFTPDPNYRKEYGPLLFEFVVSDGSFRSERATVTLILNSRPNAKDLDAGMILQTGVPQGSGNTLPLRLFATDADGDALTYEIVEQPSRGTLSALVGDQVFYTPAAGFTGYDSFTFVARDRTSVSAWARVSISVDAPPETPVALPQSLSVPFNTAKPIVLGATGTGFRYTIVSRPTRGTLSAAGSTFGPMTNNQLLYTPNAGSIGTDSFSFVVQNGPLTSTPATVTLNVLPLPLPPGPANARSLVVGGQIQVLFDAVPGASYYVILRSQTAGSYPPGYYAPLHTSPFIDTNTPRGVRFFYVVKAVTPDGSLSAASPEVSAVLP